jgi:uncharacterized protein YdhG (YjbR/CyaY superfamily)
MSTLSPVQSYISRFPDEVKNRLNTIRDLIKKIAPESGEKISYGVPTATIDDKYCVYYAGYKNHISIYPVTSAIEKEVSEALVYRTGKGTLQFPLTEPLPLNLIKKIVTTRIQEVKNSKVK